MGELADELIDRILDGHDYLDDEDDGQGPTVCRYCGKSEDLFWTVVNGKWRLFEDAPDGSNGPHHCHRGLTPKKVISNFDDIS